MKIYEYKERKNTHQTHAEDLILLGREGIEEFNDKIEKFFKMIKEYQTPIHEDADLNVTLKIDGAPAVICWSKFTDYPDNSICLKSFTTSNKNCLSSNEEIDAKYGDRPDMAEKLKYCLTIAKQIPAGEAWQGDCLYTKSDLKKETINGKEYITFHPNKIVYAVSEENESYDTIKNSEFGICFHTIYRGNLEHKTQSFNVDAKRLGNVPSSIYIMSPMTNLKAISNNYDLSALERMFNNLKSLEQKLINNPDYETLVNNEAFMKYWNTFENASLPDKQSTTLNVNTFFTELKDFIKGKIDKEYEKKLATVKTDKSRETAANKYQRDLIWLEDILESNKKVLIDLVNCFNAAATLKMELWNVLKQSKQDYSTFYKHKEKGYIPANMEGIAVSDQDGNIVKIVDRSKFSSVNRDPNYLSGFDHPEDMQEGFENDMKITLQEGNKLSRLYTHMIENERNFAIIGSLDKDDLNKSHYKELLDLTVYNYRLMDKAERENRRVSWKYLTGTYRMNNGEVITEKSILLYGISKEEALDIARKINQESIIWKDNDFFGFVYTDGREENCFSREFDFDQKTLDNFASRLTNKHHFEQPFAFKFTETISPAGRGMATNPKDITEETIFEYDTDEDRQAFKEEYGE